MRYQSPHSGFPSYIPSFARLSVRLRSRRRYPPSVMNRSVLPIFHSPGLRPEDEIDTLAPGSGGDRWRNLLDVISISSHTSIATVAAAVFVSSAPASAHQTDSLSFLLSLPCFGFACLDQCTHPVIRCCSISLFLYSFYFTYKLPTSISYCFLTSFFVRCFLLNLPEHPAKTATNLSRHGKQQIRMDWVLQANASCYGRR